MRKRIRAVTFVALAGLLWGLGSMDTLAADFDELRRVEPVDFQREVRPILAEHCFQCHGPDEATREAELRLDVAAARVAESSSGGRILSPGDPEQSEFFRRVNSTDPDTMMPPPDQQNPLDQDEIQTLDRWISSGADYQSHWAFVPPERPELPDSAGENQRPIDRFVAARLGAAGVTFSAPASSPVLARRIYLDLVGIPPSPIEVDQFVAESAADRPTAVANLVDRLLASERFGEKWARHWLDVARYADTNGYEKDMPREQWAWRDWVIDAINTDMPYDRFIVEQIAGDLLPGRTQEQLVATGFLRNGMINEEGAIIAEQFRMDGIFDRMDCVGKAIMGLSIQCAQCHTHKFDPISHDEYYGMFAFLNDTYESQSWVYTPSQRAKIKRIGESIRSLEEEIKEQHPDWKEQLAAWETQQKSLAPQWDIVDPTEAVWIGGLNHPDELPDHSVIVLGHPSASGEMYLIAEPVLEGVTGLRFEALVHHDLPFGGPGRSPTGAFAVSELRVEVRSSEAADWEPLTLASATADFAEDDHILEGEPKPEIAGAADEGVNSEKGRAGKTAAVDKRRRIGPAKFLIDGNDLTGWRADRGPGLRNTDSAAVIQFSEAITRPAGTQLKVSLVLKHARRGSAGENSQLGRLRLATTRDPDPTAAGYDHAAVRALEKPADLRTEDDWSRLFTAWRGGVPSAERLNQEIAALQTSYPNAPTSVLTMTARTTAHRRPTYLLDRGIWDQPKHEVEPHVPAVLHPLSTGLASTGLPASPTRLDFARWLAHRDSPLTARVQVNRVWQAIFGTGIVETPEDFGTRAAQPEYLELLDWLSVGFMEDGWSTKRLIKEIVSSRVYQQTSRVTPQLLSLDPRNRLLARGPRFRAEAEVVRDIALSVSGLLSERVGGPSVYPPVPQSVLDYNYVKPDYWIPPLGSDRYRRALYVFRKRSMPDPVLTTFDAPNADLACARRVRSNTPLASLVSLNEPIFVEAARCLALRILREGGSTDKDRGDYAFRLCTARRSTAEERAELVKLLSGRRKQLAEGWLSINEVATGDPGRRPEELPKGVTPQDAAAWTIVARVLLNLDETLSKN